MKMDMLVINMKNMKQTKKKLKKELGCKFIRVTDKESDKYHIGLVVKELFNITVVSQNNMINKERRNFK